MLTDSEGSVEGLIKERRLYHEILRLEAEKLGGKDKRCAAEDEQGISLCSIRDPSYCLYDDELKALALKVLGGDGLRFLKRLYDKGFIISLGNRSGKRCNRSIHFDLLIRATDTRLNPCYSKMVSAAHFALRFIEASDPGDRSFIPRKQGSSVESTLYAELEKVLSPLGAGIFVKTISRYFRIRGSNGYDAYQAYALLEALRKWSGDAFVITAPTGIGKTEIFLSLLLIKIIEAVLKNRRPRILIIYPRKMLELDQMERILLILRLLNEVLENLDYRKISVYLRDGDTWTIWNEYKRKVANEYLEYRGIKCFAKDRRGKLFIKKSGGGDYRVVCKSDSNEVSYDFVIPFMSREAKEANVVVTNLSTLMYRSVDRKDNDIDAEWIIGTDMIIVDEAHEYNPFTLAIFHYLIRSIRILKNNADLKVVISSATLGNHVSFAQILADAKNVVDLSFKKIKEKYGVDLSGKRAIIVSFVLMNPLYSWQTYLSEYLALLDFVHKLYKSMKNKNAFVPQAVVFINNVRELHRTRDVLLNALSLGSPLDNLCIRRYIDCCRGTSPIDSRYIFKHYHVLLTKLCSQDMLMEGGLRDLCRESIEENFTLEHILSKLNTVIYGETPLSERSAIYEKITRGEVACVLATSSLELGVDYPNVSIVMNIGFDKEASMIQRIGRGGRSLSKTLNTVLAIVVARNNALDHRVYFDRTRLESIVKGILPQENTPRIPKDLQTIKYLALLRLALLIYAIEHNVSGTTMIRKEDTIEHISRLREIIMSRRNLFNRVADEKTVDRLLKELRHIVDIEVEKLIELERELDELQQEVKIYGETINEFMEGVIASRDNLPKDIADVLLKTLADLRERAYELEDELTTLALYAHQDPLARIRALKRKSVRELCALDSLSSCVDKLLRTLGVNYPRGIVNTYDKLKRLCEVMSKNA